MYPDWDATPWLRRLRVLYHDEYKFICATDGRHEVYNVKQDPQESNNLSASDADVADELLQDLLELTASLTPVESPAEAPPLTEEQEKMLKALGYVGDSEPNEEGLQAGLATVASCGFVD
jgi:hypothetical protein